MYEDDEIPLTQERITQELASKSEEWSRRVSEIRETAQDVIQQIARFVDAMSNLDDEVEELPFEDIEDSYLQLSQIDISEASDDELIRYITLYSQLRKIYKKWDKEQFDKADVLYEQKANKDLQGEDSSEIQAAIQDLFEEYDKRVNNIIASSNIQISDAIYTTLQKRVLQIVEKLQYKVRALSRNIRDNPLLSFSIKDSFIDEFTAISIQQSVRLKQLSEDEGNQLLQKIKKKEVDRANQKEDKKTYSPSSTALLNEVGYDELFLTYNSEQTILSLLIKELVRPYHRQIELLVKNFLSVEEFSRLIEDSEDSLVDYLLKDRENGFPPTAERNIQMWKVVQSSPYVQVVFGDLIPEIDQKLVQELLKRTASLTPTDAVVGLYYYPSAEGVANIILSLGSIDTLNSSSRVRRQKLENILQRIMSRPDWNQIKAEIDQKFPTLLTYKNDKAGVAKSVIATSEERSPQERLARTNLDTITLFELFIQEQGKKDEYDNILRALKYIKGLNQGIESLVLDEQSDSVGFEYAVRATLLKYYKVGLKGKLEKYAFLGIDYSTYYLSELSLKILELEGNEEANANAAQREDYFLSEEVCKYLLESRFPSKSRLLLHNAIDICPSLLLPSVRKIVVEEYSELLTEEKLVWVEKLAHTYPPEKGLFRKIVTTAVETDNDFTLPLLIPEIVPILLDKQWSNILEFLVVDIANQISPHEDLTLVGKLIKRHGLQATQLIRQYFHCLNRGVFRREDNDTVLELTEKFRVLTPTLYKSYVESKRDGKLEMLTSQFNFIAERLTGGGKIEDKYRQLPFFSDLIQYVYSNNAGDWTSYELNNSCEERSGDLSGYVIRERYKIDLFSAADMNLKKGPDGESIELDEEAIRSLEQPIEQIAEIGKPIDYEKEKMRLELENRMVQFILQVDSERKIPLLHDSSLDNGSKIMILFAEVSFGDTTVDIRRLKHLLLLYIFTEYENVQAYITGTNDRVDQAKNKEYALLAELHTFFSDRVKEALRDMVEKALNHQSVRESMRQYFNNYTHSLRRQQLAKLQLDKLGVSESFIKQIGQTLNKGRKKPYTRDQILRIIKSYEQMTNDQEGSSQSLLQKPRTKAFQGQMTTQLQRTSRAIKEITGEDISNVRLWESGKQIQQFLEVQDNLSSGTYNEDQFVSLALRKGFDLFDTEKQKIEAEIDKFEIVSGGEARELNAYVSKTKDTAHARMTAGVCVSGDNPGKNSEYNLWDNPNYLQLVLQDPETLRCQGVDLMHVEYDQGKKILCVSFNPSSTYLYQTDEKVLFYKLLEKHIEFASDNGFDMVVVSKEKAIRTNRTGGQFEATMDECITKVGKVFQFSSPRVFSHDPPYQVQDMDVLWERPVDENR